LEQVRKETMFCDGIKGRPPMRKIARRKENSRLDFLREGALDVVYGFFSAVCNLAVCAIYVVINLREDILDLLASSRIGDFK
jgi:hypothetical protein